VAAVIDSGGGPAATPQEPAVFPESVVNQGQLATLTWAAQRIWKLEREAEALRGRLREAEQARDNNLARLIQTTAERDELRGRLQQAEERHAEAEAYAKEGWEWLDAALSAGGWKTVFDIPGWREHKPDEDWQIGLAPFEARLREAQEALEAMLHACGYTVPGADFRVVLDEMEVAARAARGLLARLDRGEPE
jgi:hypothetical protein